MSVKVPPRSIQNCQLLIIVPPLTFLTWAVASGGGGDAD
jgi:hypothetical protein